MANTRRTGRRVDYVWEGIGAGGATASVTTTAILQEIVAIADARTLYRVRGELLAFLTTSGAANSVKMLAVGLIVVSTEALAAGVASISSPLSDLNAPWLWHGFMICGRTTVTEGEDSFMTSNRLTVDSKSMRRLKPNQSIVFVAQPQNLAGTETIQISMGFRVLTGS